MTLAARSLLPVLFLGIAMPARAADPADPAELFPPGTLAYAELASPAAVGPQLAALFKGSPLEDSLAFIHQRREKSKDPRDHFMKEELAVLGLLASPEMATELKRVRGVAIGVTGFNEQGDADWVAAVLTGDSAAGLVARAFLTTTSVRKVAAVGTVPLYQFRQPTMGYGPDGRQMLQNDQPLTEGMHEPTFAYMPGLFLAGTSRKALSEVITRFQGQTKESLATTSAFKEAAAAYRKPGLFCFANVPQFLSAWDDAHRKTEAAVEGEPDALGWFKLIANAKAMRFVAAHVAVRDGGTAIAFGGSFEPGQQSPLLNLLAGPHADITWLQHSPAPSTIAVAVRFPEANRAAAILDFLDAVAKANGGLGRTPREAVKELEAKFKTPITGTLLGRTMGATILLPVKQDLPKGSLALPIIVLHTEDASVATAWQEFFPKLIGDLAGGDVPQPAIETIDGQKIVSVPAGTLPWKAAVHCTQKDSVFAFGLDRKLVAAAVKREPGAKSEVGSAMPGTVIGIVRLGSFLRLATAVTPPSGPVVPRGPAGPAKTVPNFGRGGFGPNGFDEPPAPPGSENLPESQKKGESGAKDAVFQAVDGLPPASLSVKRTANALKFELFQPKTLDGGLAPVVTAGIAWYDLYLNRTAGPNHGFGGPRFGRFR